MINSSFPPSCIPPRVRTASSSRGFTLIELLVVVSIIGVLVSLLLPALGRARAAAKTTRDQVAARQLMTAYAVYSNDFRGNVLPGFWNSTPPVLDENGQAITFPSVISRYPWRIMPYLEYNFAALYHDPVVLKELRAGTLPQYELSTYPSMGVNSVFVGGDHEYGGFSADPRILSQWSGFYVQRIDQVVRADHLLAFASSREQDALRGNKIQPGFHRVLPPQQTSRAMWLTSEFKPEQRPDIQGYMDYRYSDKALVTLMDGHSTFLKFDELRDMRWWSNQATDADWQLPPLK